MSNRFDTGPKARLLRFRIKRVSDGEVVGDHNLYHDACIGADIARSWTGKHYTIWDSRTKQTVYDSRRLSK